MFGLSQLEGVSSPVYLKVRPGQCLRLRHRKSSCRLCLENCPTGAISLAESLTVDNARCHGCGICANLCPTDVFQLRNLPYELLLTRVGGRDLVEFVCPSLPPTEDSLKIPCLGYLNEAVLVGAIASGSQALKLNITQCKKCQTASGLPVIVNSLRRANRILALFGRPKMISVTAEKSSAVYSPGQSQRYSRRELFSLFREETRSRVASAMDSIASDREMALKTKVRLEPRLPEKRSLLLEQMKTLAPLVTDQVKVGDLPFAQLEISSSCNGCDMCAVFCPTGALRCHDQGDRQVIDFNAGYCLACNLCLDICPEGALAYSPRLNPDDLITEGWKMLVSHGKSACAECGQSYISVAGSSLCLNCGKEKQLTEWLARKWRHSI